MLFANPTQVLYNLRYRTYPTEKEGDTSEFFNQIQFEKCSSGIYYFILTNCLGLYSFTRLKIDLLPNIEFPQLSVQVVYPGASPEDVDDRRNHPY